MLMLSSFCFDYGRYAIIISLRLADATDDTLSPPRRDADDAPY